MCLHLVPAFVIALHCTVAVDSPLGIAAAGAERFKVGGWHILQGSRPSAIASLIDIAVDTLLTDRQVAR